MALLTSVDEVTTYKEVIAARSEPTGFEHNDDTDNTLSFDDGTRTFTITPVASSFEYWIAGVKYTQTGADSLIISDVEGIHFIYYDGSTLTEATTFSNDIYKIYSYIAAIYWDATNNTAIYLGNERHGIVMSGDTHLYLHEILGTRFETGLAPGDILADESGALDTHAQLSIGAGEIHDEDIEIILSASSNPISMPVYYKAGAGTNWRKFTATDFPVRTFSGGSNLLAWNEFTGGSWQQTEISSNRFVLSHVFATNDINNPIIAIQGEAEYLNQITARVGANDEINSLITAGLPFQEFVPIATLIFQTNTAYGNTPKARIRTTDVGDDYVEWRFSKLSPTATTSSHLNLSDIGTNTHAEVDLFILSAREVLTADRTYYVRTDGSDSNDGLTDSSGGAFLTRQKAINTVASLDISIFDVTIQVGDGTYSNSCVVSGPWVGAGEVKLIGDTTTPSNVVISSANGIIAQNGAVLTYEGFKLTGSSRGIYALDFGVINFKDVDFAVTNQQIVSLNAIVNITGDYSISSGAIFHYLSARGGALNIATEGAITITMTGALNFSTAFSQSANVSFINKVASSVTYSGGTITGKRYVANRNAVIDTKGGGANFFPGDVAGTTATGGQYV